MIQKFTDLLALLLAILVIPAIWILQGLGWASYPESILGATVSIETMIVVFYFKRSGEKNGG